MLSALFLSLFRGSFCGRLRVSMGRGLPVLVLALVGAAGVCAGGREPGFSIRCTGLSNVSGCTRIGLRIENVRQPLEIYRVEWQNCDTLRQPLRPFALKVPALQGSAPPSAPQGHTPHGTEKGGAREVSLEFGYTRRFSDDDELLVHTDRGIFGVPTSDKGRYRRIIRTLRQEQSASARERTLLALALGALVLAFAAAGCVARRRLAARERQLREMAVLMAGHAHRNRELEQKVDTLYRGRLDTLNLLCNEYFEKRDSEKMRLTLYREVERQILRLRDRQSLAELETLVDTYLDGIMAAARGQLPGLKAADLDFLLYLFAGFSPRAVCIFCDIKIKNFYNRRARLRERILSSGAPDAARFAARM